MVTIKIVVDGTVWCSRRTLRQDADALARQLASAARAVTGRPAQVVIAR